jgi:glycosyltransferase involved in cell wall biosynthesis
MSSEATAAGSPPCRVLHICETARGGVGTYIDTLVALCRKEDVQQVVLPEQHRSMLAPTADCRTFDYPRRSIGSQLRMLRTALIARFRFKPDVIFCHSSLALFALLLLRPLSPGLAFIYCPHGWAGLREGMSPWKARAQRLIEGVLCGLAHRVVNVSASDLEHARKHGYRGRHVMIENAVSGVSDVTPDERLLGPDVDTINLLFVGRHDLQKGLDILLEAFVAARGRRPDLRLHVIGEAVVSETYCELGGCDESQRDGIQWLGWVAREHIDACYRAADLVVIPSRWEGLPLVVPEALRNGTPVLVSDRSGMPGLITPGQTGDACPLDADAWANRLASLDRSRLANMRPACKALFQRRYHANRLGCEIHGLYAGLAHAASNVRSQEAA